MKILMLGWELPPHNSGGLGVACYQLCKALSNAGADIDFILPYDAEHNIDFMRVSAAHTQSVTEVLKSGIAYDSFRYTHADGSVEWLDIYGQQRMFEHSIAKVVEEREFDVIHAHDWLTFRAALRAKQITNKPVILHVHSIEHDRAGGKKGNPLVHEIEQTCMLLADRIIAVSGHTKNAIVREYGIPADKIDVIHNSIDLEMVEQLDSNNAYHYLTKMKQHGYKVVVSVGRLTIQKGLNNLLQAAKEVTLRNPKTIFLFVGSGEQYYELIETAADLGISQNVVFTGFLRGKKWRDAFAVADLFVMPSVSEPFGLTPYEAIGYGTPVLISKQSGIAEVLQNCLKVEFWDIRKMADDILAVLNNDSLRDELHRNAFQEYLRLSWQDAASKLMTHYDQQYKAVHA